MENRRLMMKQELLTQSILISDLEKRLEKANLEAERAKMVNEEVTSTLLDRGAGAIDDPDLAIKLSEVKKEILRRRHSKGELGDKELIRMLKDTEVIRKIC
jgi:hypothetical protein